MKRNLLSALVIILFSYHALPLSAQTVEKVADLSFGSADGIGVGGYAPLDRFTQVGTNLWFTTSKGGTFDAGTISRFDLVTHEVVQVASFDNTTGKSPESSLLVIGDEGYFTTQTGGAGNKGTISKINLTNGIITTLYSFNNNGLPTGASPRAELTRIGDELWTTTSLGGTSNRGVVVKYNLTDGIATLVTNFDGPNLGGQAFDGFTQAGNAWYFTTFTGGDTFGQTGLTLGAGTLGRLTFDSTGNPVVTRLVDLQAGYTQFPGVRPTLVGTNSLYFGTTGPNPTPGAIIRYDIDTGNWTNLFSFPTNTAESLQYGTRPGYSGMVEWLGDLYFINRQGGSAGLGTVAKFNIASNTVAKLADLEGTAGQALGSASGFFGSGTLVEETNHFFIYWALTSGGVNNRGTIVRVALSAQPIQSTLAANQTGQLVLSWTGGYAPFTIQSTPDLSGGNWTNLFVGITNRSVTLPVSEARAFFRVGGSQ